jgi:hypothetical protein
MKLVLDGSGVTVDTDKVEWVLPDVTVESIKDLLDKAGLELDIGDTTGSVDAVLERIGDDEFDFVVYPHTVVEEAEATLEDSDLDLVSSAKSLSVEFLYDIQKTVSEDRFTLSPWYIPDSIDGHGDFMTADDLQKTLWGYVKKGDRSIRLQHDPDTVAGEWVELMAWPHEVEIDMALPGVHKADSPVTKTYKLPAGTVYMGVEWTEEAWKDVKAGRILGLSIGGRSGRIMVDMDT